MRVRAPLVAALLTAVVAACSPGVSAPPTDAPAAGATAVVTASPAAAVDVQVYAAASLKKMLDAATAAYEAATPGVTLTVSTDSSTALATKIGEGAPADVFLSADMQNPQALVDKALALGPVTPFAGNTLTVIVPADNPAGITTVRDLGNGGVKIIACADGVPIQAYTARLLDNLVAKGGFPVAFPAAYTANVVSAEDNVGALVAKVALGEGDAGIVYVTDAKGNDRVSTIEIPPALNVAATYGGVVVAGSKNQDAAAAFLTWLAGPDGQAILRSFGFGPPVS